MSVFYNIIGGAEFPFLKKFVEETINPLTKNLGVIKRDQIRNQIRYAETPEILEENLYSFNEKYKFEIDVCDLLEKFNTLNKQAPLIQKDNSILNLLSETEQEIRYLDLGEINNIWYFGFSLKGKDAILTSDGKVLRNTREKLKKGGEEYIVGENEITQLFDYQGYIGNIARQISKETVKKYYTKTERNHLVNPKEVYKAIKEKILYYMDFPEEIADILACWIIATYCYPLFYWFSHILFNAPSTSGKSKCAYIVLQMAFRGYDLGASAGVTPPQVFRTIEGNRGTILLDEYENFGSETQQLVNQILNASPEKDAYVIRTEQINKKWLSYKFPIFCPKIACNISGINPTSLSRFIAFKWLKTKSEKGKRKPQREKDKQSFTPIREDLYILILENWEKIKDIYGNLDVPELNNREEDNWLPLFAIARFIDNCEGELLNVEDQLKKYLNSYEELNIETDDNTNEFFHTLKDVIKEERYYTPKELANIPEIQELFPFLKSPANWIGKKLKLYKFPFNRGGGRRKYLLSQKSINEIIGLYFNTEIMTHNDTNNTQQHKQHITTQEDVPLCEVCDVTKEVI